MNKAYGNGIYLDHAAAATPSETMLRQLVRHAGEAFVNQEAIHSAAYDLRCRLQEAGGQMAEAICGSRENTFVHWCDSGTDAIRRIAGAPAFASANIVTTAAEHPAMTAALAGTGGSNVIRVNLRNGLIDLEHLRSILSPATRLVAIHHVQSETGTVQDLSALRAVMDEVAPGAILLADTIQSAGKLPIPWRQARLDFALVSGHKLGVPGGAAIIGRDSGALKESLAVYFTALRREKYLVGRANPVLALTLSGETCRCCADIGSSLERVAAINALLRHELPLQLPVKPVFTQSPANATPYILHFVLKGYQGAVLVRMLSEEHNIFVSSGSACNAETKVPSPALTASGVSRRDAFSGLRVSLSPSTTVNEAELMVSALRNCLERY